MTTTTGLSVSILPTPAQTAMLRACLWTGQDQRQAWAEWQDRFGGPRTMIESEGQKRLVPLLAEAARRNDVDLESGIQTILRTAVFWEQLRLQRCRSICRRALDALNIRAIDVILLKGVAVANADYPDAALRHCHDCDLLIRKEQREDAVETLRNSGFRSLPNLQGSTSTTVMLDESGLPIQLHQELFLIQHYAASLKQIRSRAESWEICGVTTRILAPEDRLLHVCGHASCNASREHLCWVCDSWMILTAKPDWNWPLFCETVQRWRLSLPLAVLLRYLARDLGAPIPDDVLDRLENVSAEADVLDREAAIFGVASSSRTDIVRLWMSATGWAERAVLLKWMFLPAPSHLRWAYRLRYGWLIPIYYLYRPFHGLFRRLRM